MDLFHVIEEGQVIICSHGVYRQAKVYRRGEDVFAQYGNGYIKLYNGCGTSKPKVSWLGIEAAGVELTGSMNVPKWKGGNDGKDCTAKTKKS